MNSTLIEKVKDFLYLGKNPERFGIIKVFPYLCYKNHEKTKERAILESHHLKNYKYSINVRSEQAINDVTKALLVYDFKYKIRKGTVEKTRRWFSLTEPNLLRYLNHKECSIIVDVTEDSLEKFIGLIENLQITHSYRNIYQGTDEIFYIV